MKQQHYSTYKALLAAGINELQAAAIIRSIAALSKQIANQYSTRDEIKKLTIQTESLFDEIEKIELRMTIKMGSIAAITSGLLFSALKLWL